MLSRALRRMPYVLLLLIGLIVLRGIMDLYLTYRAIGQTVTDPHVWRGAIALAWLGMTALMITRAPTLAGFSFTIMAALGTFYGVLGLSVGGVMMPSVIELSISALLWLCAAQLLFRRRKEPA